MRHRLLTILLVLLLCAPGASAQRLQVQAAGTAAAPVHPVRPDSAHWFPAAACVLGVNGSMMLLNRYLFDFDYSHVTGQTIRQNFRTGFVWDNDSFLLNQTGHPIQGGFYHICARACGLSYWEALPLDILGSLTWELFGETDPPSLNDLVTTPVAGLAVGEMLWRTGSLIYDRASGRGGEAISGEVQAGWRLSAGRSGGYAAVRFEYGDPSAEEGDSPYDHFSVRLQAGFGGGQPFAQEEEITGRIWGSSHISRRGGDVTFGIYQHFRYYESAAISVSQSACFGPGAVIRRGAFDQRLFASAVLMGAVTADHYRVLDRDYCFGSGFSLESVTTCGIGSRVRMSLGLSHLQLFSSERQGEAGTKGVTAVRPEIRFLLGGGFGISLTSRLIGLHSHCRIPSASGAVSDRVPAAFTGSFDLQAGTVWAF